MCHQISRRLITCGCGAAAAAAAAAAVVGLPRGDFVKCRCGCVGGHGGRRDMRRSRVYGRGRARPVSGISGCRPTTGGRDVALVHATRCLRCEAFAGMLKRNGCVIKRSSSVAQARLLTSPLLEISHRELDR